MILSRGGGESRLSNPKRGNFSKANELMYKTETDPQTQKTNLWLPKGKGRERDKLGVWD